MPNIKFENKREQAWRESAWLRSFREAKKRNIPSTLLAEQLEYLVARGLLVRNGPSLELPTEVEEYWL